MVGYTSPSEKHYCVKVKLYEIIGEFYFNGRLTKRYQNPYIIAVNLSWHPQL